MTFFRRHLYGNSPWRVVGTLMLLLSASAFAHGVSESDKGFLQGSTGVQFLPFMYLGAKHMVTGYDHLLFLCGVIWVFGLGG